MPGCSPARPVPLSPRPVSSPSLLCREEKAQSGGQEPWGAAHTALPGEGGLQHRQLGAGTGESFPGDTGDSRDSFPWGHR